MIRKTVSPSSINFEKTKTLIHFPTSLGYVVGGMKSDFTIPFDMILSYKYRFTMMQPMILNKQINKFQMAKKRLRITSSFKYNTTINKYEIITNAGISVLLAQNLDALLIERNETSFIFSDGVYKKCELSNV